MRFVKNKPSFYQNNLCLLKMMLVFNRSITSLTKFLHRRTAVFYTLYVRIGGFFLVYPFVGTGHSRLPVQFFVNSLEFVK